MPLWYLFYLLAGFIAFSLCVSTVTRYFHFHCWILTRFVFAFPIPRVVVIHFQRFGCPNSLSRINLERLACTLQEHERLTGTAHEL